MQRDEFQLDAFVVAMDAEILVEGPRNANAIGVDFLGPEQRRVGCAGRHHGNGDGFGQDFVLRDFQRGEHIGTNRGIYRGQC
jgi:hypothetical protein